jgi:hypothetical protein
VSERWNERIVCAFPDAAMPLENAVAGRPFIGVPW